MFREHPSGAAYVKDVVFKKGLGFLIVLWQWHDVNNFFIAQSMGIIETVYVGSVVGREVTVMVGLLQSLM